MNDFIFLEDILKKPEFGNIVTDVHTIGKQVAVQTTKGLQIIPGYEVSDTLGHKILEERGLDSSETVAGRRIRVHVSRLGGEKCDLSIRVFPQSIRTLEECDAPEDIVNLTGVRAGLIVVGGHTGSRKTTLVGGMIDKINTDRDAVIITVEDPVEIIHSPKRGIVRHKEISKTLSWSDALRDLYRENADVLVIGETRDYEAINAALDLALSGKLVITTIHASCVEDAIRQFIGRAPAEKAEIVANNLADAITAVIVQRITLFRSFQREYMIFSKEDRQLIRDIKRVREIGPNLDNKSRQNKPGYKVFPSENETVTKK